MRRSRRIYLAIVAVVLAALGLVAAVAWVNGESAHASLHTASHPAPALTLSAPSATQTRAWHSDDRTALGVPVQAGTVVTYGEHTVSGRDARTGRRTWTYTRTDRTVCDAVQLAGTTVAIFDRDGNCDEVDAFQTTTGRRAWDRTLDENGQPMNGRPAIGYYDNTLMITSPSVIYAINAQDGIDVWTYSRYGCRIENAVLGAAGALVSQDCTAVRCAGIAKCGKGRQLFLRDGQAGRDDTSKANFDHILWNDIGNTGVPVSADTLITAVQPGSNVLDTLNATDGKQLGTVELTPAPTDLAGISAIATDSAELIWIDHRLTAVARNSSSPLWSVPAASHPTVVDPDGDAPPVLSRARITLTGPESIEALDYDTGATVDSFAVGAEPAGALAWPMGTGFLVSDSRGTSAYR